MTQKYIASVSFGKDSLAMLLKCLELNYPLDEVVFVDTGMEFQAIYDIETRVKSLLKEKQIKYTRLTFDKPFEYYMFEHIKKNGKKGYSWCGGVCRWGTTKKLQCLNQYCNDAIQYVGIAYDEPHRVKTCKNKAYPLIDFKMTEQDCLEYCYNKGFYWEENSVRLYDILDRVSCWCCSNKNLKELRNYQKFLPQYWQKILKLQSKTDRLMNKAKTYKQWLIIENVCKTDIISKAKGEVCQ